MILDTDHVVDPTPSVSSVMAPLSYHLSPTPSTLPGCSFGEVPRVGTGSTPLFLSILTFVVSSRPTLPYRPRPGEGWKVGPCDGPGGSRSTRRSLRTGHSSGIPGPARSVQGQRPTPRRVRHTPSGGKKSLILCRRCKFFVSTDTQTSLPLRRGPETQSACQGRTSRAVLTRPKGPSGHG